ncbi:MAG: deoxyribose-phosphate aldolase [Acidobacteria bacterium]|nr:deoxyribose-phosphate aldolase [Acidobacteriota bacterium]
MGSPSPGSDLASLIDHTLLKPEATRPQVTQLCREALEYGFAAVCVNPYWVRTCAALVKGSPVVVASVVGFPLGATTTDAKVYEARRALFDGAREIDMVINVGALKSHEDEAVRKDMEEVVRACHEADSQTKVILETALLTQEEKVRACVLAREAGADFVKTSTGFGPGGATAEDVALMRSVVGPGMGIKAAGGIKDYETAKRLVEAGATRIGASAGVRIVQQQAAPAATPY